MYDICQPLEILRNRTLALPLRHEVLSYLAVRGKAFKLAVILVLDASGHIVLYDNLWLRCGYGFLRIIVLTWTTGADTDHDLVLAR